MNSLKPARDKFTELPYWKIEQEQQEAGPQQKFFLLASDTEGAF
jgi:hypothetical protein